MKTIYSVNEKYEIYLSYYQDEDLAYLKIRNKEMNSETQISLPYKELKNLIDNLKHMKNLMEF